MRTICFAVSVTALRGPLVAPITIETATKEVKAYFRDVRSLAKFVRMKRDGA